MKKSLLILGLAVVFLSGTHQTLAVTSTPSPTTDSNATTTSCFSYYKFGSVQVHIDPMVAHVSLGQTVKFKGVIVSANSYPIVDGSVYVKIFREDSKNTRQNAFPLVDQFVAKDNISLAANGTSSIEFNWVAPINAMSGNYRVATFFQSADEYSLLGLTFTNDVIGNSTNFKIDGTANSGVILSKDDVTVAGQHFMFAAYPPVVNATSVIPINTVLINTTKQAQDISVKWSVYKWDSLRKENFIEQKTQLYNAKPGQTKVSFSISDTRYPVYYIVAEADYKDSKSILDIRFARATKTDLSLMLPAVTSYPLKKGVPATLFSCLWAVSLSDVSGGKLELSIVDQNGNPVESLQYSGTVTSAMMALKKDFVPTKDLANFTIKAKLYQDGVLKDSASMVYDCQSIDPSLCSKTDGSSQGGVLLWTIAALIGLIIIVGIVAILGRRKGSMTVLFVLFAAGFAHFAMAADVQWSGNNQRGMIVKNVDETALCLVFNGSGEQFISDGVCNNGTGTNGATPPGSVSMTVKYRAEIIDTGFTGQDAVSVPLSGGTVSSGTHLRLRFLPHVYTDITWNGTGGYIGSPYGYWQSGAASPGVFPRIDVVNYLENPLGERTFRSDDTGTVANGFTLGDSKLYMGMSVDPPTKTITGLNYSVNGLDCGNGNLISDTAGGLYVDCKVIATSGSITNDFLFAPTTAKFYSKFAKTRTNAYGVITNSLPLAPYSSSRIFYAHNATGGQLLPYIQDISERDIVFTYTVNPIVVSPPPPTVTLVANPTQIPSGSSSRLTWTPANATSCTATGAWTGPKTAITGSYSQLVSPLSTSIYTITCFGPGGTSTPASATVTVTAAVGICTNANFPNGYPTGSTECSGTNKSPSVSTPWARVASCPAIGNVCKFYVPTTLLPDLTAGSVSPTTATVNKSTSFSATISNAHAPTGGGFNNFFQTATNAAGTENVTDLTPAFASLALPAGGSVSALIDHAFPSAGIYYMRVCADKSSAEDEGVIDEGELGELNNCGDWAPVVVSQSGPISYSCTGGIPSGNVACPNTQSPSNSLTPWSPVSTCPTNSTNVCKYYSTTNPPLSGMICYPTVTVNGVISTAAFANVGQLVTWTAVGTAPASYSWSASPSGLPVLGTAASYSVRYSTIGYKEMYLNKTKCTTGVTSPNDISDVLPIANNPNFHEF